VNRKKREQKPTFDLSRLKEDVDTYTDGIYALVTLVHHARWDDTKKALRNDVRFGVGRRMRTLNKRPAADANTEVTPDCVIQIGSAQGVVAEVKPGVARGKAIWEKNLRQIWKYDDALDGWWTPDGRLASHDIVALVPISRAVDFADLVKARIADGGVSFVRPLTVLAFFKNTGAEKVFVTVKTEYGGLTDPALSERFRRAVPVDWKHLITNYHDPKFIDAEPPLAYTLWVLWDYVFSQKASGRQPDAGQRWIGVDVEVPALTAEVQKYYGFSSDGPRSVEIPRQQWIRHALDALVVFGKAKKTSDLGYLIKYSRHKAGADTLAQFGRRCVQHGDRLYKLAAKKPLIAIAESAPSVAATQLVKQ